MFENWRIIEKQRHAPATTASARPNEPWKPCVPTLEPFRTHYLGLTEEGQQAYDRLTPRQRLALV